MGMRLLKKHEIDQEKARERQHEIDEGLKIAKKVDRLRETAVEEEASLQKFRDQQLKQITAEIKEATKERDQIRRERDEAKRVRDHNLKPLKEEWDKLHTAEQDYQRRLRDSEARSRELDQRDGKLKRQLSDADRERKQARSQLEIVAEERFQSSKDLRKAREEYARADKIKTETEKLKEEVLKDLRERDAKTAARERDVKLKEEAQQAERVKLDNEWKLLEDRKQMLDRQFNRLNKK